MGLFGGKKPKLTREQSLSAYPVVNQLISYEELDNGELRVLIPRRDTGWMRWVGAVLKLPSHRNVVLDEIGTFVVKLCDGEHRVKEIVDLFRKKYKLNAREAEVSMIQYLRMLAQRGIIVLAVPVDPGGKDDAGDAEPAQRKPDRNKDWKQRKKQRRKKR